MGVTFTVSRIELKKILTVMGVSEMNIDSIISQLNKMHRHVNAVVFAGMLQKTGLKTDDVTNILRRIGIDDVSITNIFDAIDEERIKSAYGKMAELRLG